MSTENQVEANRLNAQHCTGPKTEEGKARSSQNALKSGLYSQKEVIATESREDYEALAAEYHNHYAPANPHERSLVDALVRYEWLSRRYMAADTALWNYFMSSDKVPNPGDAFMRQAENLSRAGRYFNNARKGYASTMKELEAAQSKRQAVPSRDGNRAVMQPSTGQQPSQNQPVTPKLVSFRQPAASPGEAPAKKPETGLPPEPDTEKVPPIAA